MGKQPKKHIAPTRVHHKKHTCQKCNGTEVCPNCRGNGCVDCNYTGECPACQPRPVMRGSRLFN